MNRTPQILSRALGTKFFYILLLATSVSLNSCDEASVVGLDVQPSTDLLNVKYIDTVSLITQTVKEDSLKTDESILDRESALLGKYIDPIFGTTSSSIYTGIKLSTTISTASFGTNPIIDSVVMTLVYDTAHYGKRERKMQTVEVYQLTENIPIDAIYFSNNTLSKSTLPLATQNFIPKPKDSVLVYSKKEKPQLRIRLDSNFGQTILNNQASGNLANNTAVQNFIKGFYITTENSILISPEDGNILHFNTSDAQTKVTVYYRNNAADSLKYDFALNGVARFINFKHDYAGTNMDPDLASQLTAATFSQNSTVFIQSLAGVKVKVKMPYIKRLNDSGAVAINKAELVIKVNTNSLYKLDSFATPKKIVLFGINDDGTTYQLPDAFEGENYYGSTYNATTKEYRFNIARYIQQVLSGEKNNNGIYMLASAGAVNANRVVIGGGAAGANQIKLNITYTKLH